MIGLVVPWLWHNVAIFRGNWCIENKYAKWILKLFLALKWMWFWEGSTWKLWFCSWRLELVPYRGVYSQRGKSKPTVLHGLLWPLYTKLLTTVTFTTNWIACSLKGIVSPSISVSLTFFPSFMYSYSLASQKYSGEDKGIFASTLQMGWWGTDRCLWNAEEKTTSVSRVGRLYQVFAKWMNEWIMNEWN